MAGSAAHVFHGITPEKYARLVEKARGAGIEMQGNSGSATKFGVEVEWNYSPETQDLTLQCLRTPFFLTAADVDAKIQSLVTEAMA